MLTKAARIHEARKSKFRSQQALAKAMSARSGEDITRGAVGNWEHGGGITYENLRLLAEVTGYRLEYLAEGKMPKLAKDAPAAPDPAAIAAGRRLEGIRAALCPDLPAQIGIASEVVWETVIRQPGGLDSRIAQQVAEKTGLPLGYIQDGVTSGLTIDQLTALLAFHSARP